MKIVMPVSNNSPDALIDDRFGRCPYFAIHDTESGKTTFVANDVQESGSGVNAASNVLKFSPDAVITLTIGPKAFRVIKTSGTKIYEGVKGNIKQNIELLTRGELKEINAPNN
ncbi:NifB/NifX family molybdenum-iron cluster-binding protein [Thermosyntropha sp.]|uniref:NifB/NifX family molybdenum-iron cluster-binding protein n=1 Tax=Thermosyntropha sp. TaxID=2740820 RepID=UPI0025E5F42D|nr:NifB/NifX family molybdenum-iron cluster-binding protein [Thermosyntropha sp.]MBO8158232.1 NifB/NifX family molybdenum-iron cluster-binding protein [Thermosyntropha sp.]